MDVAARARAESLFREHAAAVRAYARRRIDPARPTMSSARCSSSRLVARATCLPTRCRGCSPTPGG